ncbi:alpha/beta hydrolase [Paenibacillus glycanilyticus]|uniref:alpha/beta fold hydrolase n=1 Tax=Paenibacillus glycanilyticus TaxID=126569 RepID=UPI00204035DB|nr:alpha/beta hydrolase [Paenibacillus glycanilyticus]MCM3626824.1 alpha/beta hydrolase [Paenibacillus glycanilyticus]
MSKHEINSPTLIIAGQFDTVTLPSHSERIAEPVSGSKLVMFPAVHLPNVEFPAEYIREVLDFLVSKTI